MLKRFLNWKRARRMRKVRKILDEMQRLKPHYKKYLKLEKRIVKYLKQGLLKNIPMKEAPGA